MQTTVPAERPTGDLLDPDFYAGDPYPLYAWLRTYDPVHRYDGRFGRDRGPLFVVSRYEDLSYVERTPELFCSRHGIRPTGAASISIISMDAPEHTDKRRIVNRGFTPRRVAELTDRIRLIARELVDAVAPRGECDFVAEIAYQLPLIVIAEMLGMPAADRPQLGRWSDLMIAAEGVEDIDDPRIAAAAQGWVDYAGYLGELIERRRRDPQDDLISVLIHAQDTGRITNDGHRVDAEMLRLQSPDASELMQDELLMFLTLLMPAGHETTRNALSGGLVALGAHPDVQARVAADPSLIPAATEEILRYVSPVLSFTRTVTAATELAGTRLVEGDRVLLLYGSANRDAAVFGDPDRFDIDRDPNPHLAFGIGPHFCLGANLARLEIRILLEELLGRLPDVRPDGDAVRLPSTIVRGIESLPVTFTPA